MSEEYIVSLAETSKSRIREQVKFGSSHGLLCSKLVEYLICLQDSCKIPTCRILAKVHKNPCAGRLITVGRIWLTNTISLFVARALQAVLSCISSVAKDTGDVIAAVESCCHDSPPHVSSFDVEALYPSIPQAGALEAVRILFYFFLFFFF